MQPFYPFSLAILAQLYPHRRLGLVTVPQASSIVSVEHHLYFRRLGLIILSFRACMILDNLKLSTIKYELTGVCGHELLIVVFLTFQG